MTQEHYEWMIFLLGFGSGFGIAIIVARLVNQFIAPDVPPLSQ